MQIPLELLRPRLLSPGPTPVATKHHMAALPVLYHRSEAFTAIFNACGDWLKPYIGSREKPIFLSCSGTGAMEAVVQNICTAGDEVACLVGGKFGERWQEIAEAYGAKVSIFEVEWGFGVDLNKLEAFLKTKKNIKAFFCQAVETSTGIAFPIEAISKMLHSHVNDALLIVDAISALVSHPFKMDDWGVDVMVGASQKCFSTPPGLCFVNLSDRAWSRLGKTSRFYFDFERERSAQKQGAAAFTPPVSLFQTLHACLESMNHIGVNNLQTYFANLAASCRSALKALNLKLVDETAFTNTLSVAFLPEGIDGKLLINNLKKNFNATFAGGQDRLQGKIIRISHIGMVDPFDILAALVALEQELIQLGHKTTRGVSEDFVGRFFR